MDTDEFWSLIEEARRGARPDPRDGYMDRFVAKLEQLLRARSPEEVFEFSNRFENRIREALTDDLWDAAGLILQRSFDDGQEWPLHWFDYFGGWLISMGREVYERALAEPDSLVEPASRPGIEDWFLDELVCVPDRVYEEMTGTELPGYPDPDDPDEPSGTEQREDKPELSQRLPKLWAKFGR